MKADYDNSYKLLFSHPEMVRDLLVGFVHEDWVGQLDFSTLEKVNGSYVGDDLRDREDDVIWRVRLGDAWLYVYILLEFQATVNAFMPVRMTDYVVSLYQDLRKAGQLTDKKLPPVFPVVVYNGRPRWDVPCEINEMIVPVPGLNQYQVHMRHVVLDVVAMADSELESLRNLAAVLFRLEKSRSVETVRDLVKTLVAWLNAPEQASLRRAFTVWLRRVLLPKRMVGSNIPEMSDLHEVDTMLAETVQEWVKPWLEKGRLEGRSEGRQEGRQEGRSEGLREGLREGEMRSLLRLIQRRFGPVPDWVQTKLAAADLATLETWTERILDAESLQAVFQ